MQADEESGGAARRAFDRFDADRSGTLTKDECVELIAASGFSVTPSRYLEGASRYLEGVWTVYPHEDVPACGCLDRKFVYFHKYTESSSAATKPGLQFWKTESRWVGDGLCMCA